MLIKQNVIIAIQINGKLKGTVESEVDATKETVHKLAMNINSVESLLKTKTPKKVIFLTNKIMNFVV